MARGRTLSWSAMSILRGCRATGVGGQNGVVDDRSRTEVVSRDVILGLLLFALAVLVGVSRCTREPPAPSTLPEPSSTPSAVAVPTQPDPQGYEYTVRRERYVVRQSEAEPLEVQSRLRESWRAPDGWAWARQTGDEPAHFIFAPYAAWRWVTEVRPRAEDLDAHLRTRMVGATPSEVDDQLFNFVYEVFSVATLPAGTLPGSYREALVDMLAGLGGVTVTRNVPDPDGRTSTQVTFVTDDHRPGMVQSLYLDADNQFLAYDFTVAGTGDVGADVITERRIVSAIPDDVLHVLGSDRVEKQLWQ